MRSGCFSGRDADTENLYTLKRSKWIISTAYSRNLNRKQRTHVVSIRFFKFTQHSSQGKPFCLLTNTIYFPPVFDHETPSSFPICYVLYTLNPNYVIGLMSCLPLVCVIFFFFFTAKRLLSDTVYIIFAVQLSKQNQFFRCSSVWTKNRLSIIEIVSRSLPTSLRKKKSPY